MADLEPPAPRSPWRIRVQNLRALPPVDWSPSGVCLLAGPNGSGKTTLLEALQFPRFYYRDGRTTALQNLDGASNLRRLGAADDEPVIFEIEEGDANWRIEIPIEGVGVHPYFGERVTVGDEVQLEARRYEGSIEFQGELRTRKDGDRCAFRRIWPEQAPRPLMPLIDRIQSVRVHYSYQLAAVRRQGAGAPQNEYLHPTGRNLWAVLRRWREQGAATPFEMDALEWVKVEAGRAFPDIFSDLRFDAAGEPRFYIPGEDQGLPVHLAADGLLVGLLHLTATAGASPGSILAFDEMENQLHPHAIRSILAAMRARADELDLTIILTTHSPVLMNEFKGDEESFFVLDRSVAGSSIPTPLTAIKDPAWLRHFALGDLYDRLDIAAPTRAPR